MARHEEKGSFAADIPDDVIAEAIAAVEKREPPPTPGETLDSVKAQLREQEELRLRAAADLENFRKRAAREKEDAQRLGIERLVADLLPVLDNLERALQAVPEGPVALGVAMTRRLLDDTLARHGLRSVAAEVGSVFDPRVHQAVTTVVGDEHPAGTIVAQEQRGYCLHDRLLRPASVVVAAPREKP